jgi:homocitrate synthase NifV
MALQKLLSLDPGIHTPALSPLSALVVQASGRVLPDWKPVTGPACFRHESGIHTAGMAKDRLTYEPFPAEEVGRPSPAFVIGRHSGTHGLRQILEQQELSLAEEKIPLLLELVRRLSLRKKSALSVQELLPLVTELERTL